MTLPKLIFTAGGVLLLSLLNCISPARAQRVRPLPSEGVISEGLTAHGHAEIKAKPDIAYVTVSVTTQSTDQTKATQDNARRSNALMDALKAAGIAAKDIQTQYYSVQPQYDYKNSPPALAGYQVTNSVQVTVHDLMKAGVIVDKATQGGANEVGDLSFDLANRHQVEQQALAAAVTDAHGKADAMATAAGLSLGRVLSLSEGTPTVVQPIMFGAMRSAAAAPATPISPQQISVTADVTAVYAFSPAGG